MREELLEAQAAAIGVPLTKIYLPSGKDTPCTNEVYEQIMGRVMEDFRSRGVSGVGFGSRRADTLAFTSTVPALSRFTSLFLTPTSRPLTVHSSRWLLPSLT